MGDKVGRIHLGRQDLKDLQTRKMKGLKRSRDVDTDVGGDDDDLVSQDGDDGAEGEKKKARKA